MGIIMGVVLIYTLEFLRAYNPQQICTAAPKVSTINYGSKGECICREVLERRFGKPFPRKRPSWLVNSKTGKRMELDCYCEELKLAAEYNGKQHYEWPNQTGQSKEKFIDQVKRDKLKEVLCQRQGVRLIVVPYTVKHSDIERYILEAL